MAKTRKKTGKRKLNLKVAIIGLVVLMIIAGTIILVLRKRGRDPQVFLQEAEIALKNKEYQEALTAYSNAYNFSGPIEKVNILFNMAEVALIADPGDPELDRAPKEPDWRKALGFFNQITVTDPKNIDARMRILEFAYQTGDTGQANSWETVKKVSQEIIDLSDEANTEPDLFVLMARGRASLEIAIMGQTANIEQEVKEAEDYLIRLLRRSPDNFDGLWYLAHAQIIQGEINENAGILNGWDEGIRRAEIVIQESIDRNPDNPDAYLNMLKLRILQSQDAKSGAEARAKLEDQQKAVKDRFPDNPEIDYEMAGFYVSTPQDTPKALEAIERAVQKVPEKMEYVIRASRIAYINAKLQDKPELIDRALELALAGLDLPEAQETTGPNEVRNKNNQLILNSFIVQYYIDKALALEIEDRKEFIDSAESHIHDIKQILGLDNPVITRWNAMVKLAKGDNTDAIRDLVKSYNQYDAVGKVDPQLAYDLSSIIANGQYIGARQKYLGTAIKNGIVTLGEPEAILEFAELLLKLRSPDTAISLVQRYEEVMEPSGWSTELLLNAYIQANLFDKAEKILSLYEEDSIKTLRYRLQIEYTRLLQLIQMKSRQELLMEPFAQNRINTLADQIQEIRVNRYDNAKLMLAKDPDSLDFGVISGICIDLVDEDLKPKAIDLNEKYLSTHKDSFAAKVLRKKLAFPNPTQIGDDELIEIQIEVAETIENEQERLKTIAQIYNNSGKFSEALDYYQKALNNEPENKELIASVYDSAISTQNYEIAEKLRPQIEKYNIDECGGAFFTGRLAMAREQYDKAIDRFTECTEIRPLFPISYLNLSIIYNTKGDEVRAIENAQKAVELNPLNAQITLNNAMVLYNRNRKLGEHVTSQQKDETGNAILRAIKMNPSNTNLQSIYAEYIADTDPGNALAVRQSIFKTRPTKENALLLARMALKNATDPWDSPKKQAMYRIADDAYKNAMAISPGDPEVLDAYADFFRISGQGEKITELIGNNKEILWKSYYRRSKFAQAKEILDELYNEDPKSIDILKGLIGTSLKLFRNQDVDRYTKELINIENNFENRLLRVQALVEVGETTKAEEEISQMSDQDRNDIKIMMLNSTIALRKGLFEEAISQINKALEIDKKNAIAWRIKGRANYLQANYEQALQDFLKSKTYQENNIIRIELAKTYDRMARYEPAIAELKLTLEEEGTPQVALMLLEEIYSRSMKYAQLREYYDSMSKRYEEDSYWLRRRADLEYKLGDLDLASEYYLKAWDRSQANPSSIDIKSLRGYFDVLIEQAKYTDLLSYAVKYVDNDFGPVVYTAMAEAKAKMGDIENSLNYFGKAMSKAKFSFQMIDQAVKRMIAVLDRNTIIDWINSNVQQDPQSINRNMVAFNFNLQSQNYNKAVKYLDNAIAVAEQNSQLRRALIITKANTLQMAYNKVPDKDYLTRSVTIYEELLSQTPGDVSLLNNLAYLLASSEIDLQKAEEIAARAYMLAPENGLILDTYGLALIKNRKYEKAEQLLSRAIQTLELSSTSAPYVIYEHLGLALERLNKPQEAKAAYERALEIGENELSISQKEEMKERISRLARRIF
ncbi:MAG: tetratricopeptide repeat protein [Sedimentisphaeraceae bacterium JB056]